MNPTRTITLLLALVQFTAYGYAVAATSNITEPQTENREAIHKLAADVDAAWNERDAADLGALFTDDGDFRYHTGRSLRGRKQIEQFYASTAFPAMPTDLRHKTVPEHIRFVTDDVAIGDGSIQITHAATLDKEEEPYLSLLLTSVVVKEQGRWRIAAVRLMVPQPE